MLRRVACCVVEVQPADQDDPDSAVPCLTMNNRLPVISSHQYLSPSCHSKPPKPATYPHPSLDVQEGPANAFCALRALLVDLEPPDVTAAILGPVA